MKRKTLLGLALILGAILALGSSTAGPVALADSHDTIGNAKSVIESPSTGAAIPHPQTEACTIPPAQLPSLYLPIVLKGNGGSQNISITQQKNPTPQNGICPAGYHLVHCSGEVGIANPDTEPYNDADYTCQPDETLDGLTCSGHGQPYLADGLAVCACDEGYAGATCDSCAPGFELQDNQCRPAIPAEPEPIVRGAEQVIEAGELRQLTVETFSTASLARFEWTVTRGRGCLRESAGSRCEDSLQTGVSVFYQAPSVVGRLEPVVITVEPIDPPGRPTIAPIFTQTTNDIPSHGYGSDELAPVLAALKDFMRYRCVGAATLGISWYGQPVGVWGLGRMDGRAAADWDPACGDDLTTPLALPVTADAPFPIGSITKPYTFAMLRWALKEVAFEAAGVILTDAQLETIKPFDPTHNNNPNIPGTTTKWPVKLVPDAVYDVFSGNVPYPAALPDSGCSDLTGFADPQWQQVTFGHILSHSTGLQGGLIYDIDLVSNLASLRDLTDQNGFADQEAILTADPANDVAGAKAALGYPANTDVYFLPGPNLEEFHLALAGRCLQFDLGQYFYSNVTPALATLIVEQLVASGRLTAEVGDPDSHLDSALQIFMQQSLGFPTTGSTGVFAHQRAIGIPGYAYPGPRGRAWSSSANSYYPTDWDVKRAHCVWSDGSGCSFSDWLNQSPGRVNWDWKLEQVPFDLARTGISSGVGSFYAEPLAQLEFMSKYWVGGYTPTSDPRIGEPHNNTWNLFSSHSGSIAGGRAFARQWGGQGAGSSINLPPQVDGVITDDFGNVSSYSLASLNCTIPAGVHFFVATAQRWDKKCDDDDSYTCKSAYNRLLDFTYYGLCQVNWSKVQAPSALAVDDIVFP